jgi:hypothetical protein
MLAFWVYCCRKTKSINSPQVELNCLQIEHFTQSSFCQGFEGDTCLALWICSIVACKLVISVSSCAGLFAGIGILEIR